MREFFDYITVNESMVELIVLSSIGLTAFIFILINKNWYSKFYVMGVLWSDLILFFMGMIPFRDRSLNIKPEAPYIFVANHVSMIDVMLLG